MGIFVEFWSEKWILVWGCNMRKCATSEALWMLSKCTAEWPLRAWTQQQSVYRGPGKWTRSHRQTSFCSYRYLCRLKALISWLHFSDSEASSNFCLLSIVWTRETRCFCLFVLLVHKEPVISPGYCCDFFSLGTVNRCQDIFTAIQINKVS